VGAAALGSAFASAFVSCGAAGAAAVESDFSLSFEASLGEAYRSEYQPPPFRMKLVPRLMRRCASFCAHAGHSSTGASVIR
jgi:hypothetical protein